MSEDAEIKGNVFPTMDLDEMRALASLAGHRERWWRPERWVLSLCHRAPMATQRLPVSFCGHD